jgi:phosphoribosylaminoimidazolecarboxamide formyltransferase/IMP cyclohydrolase
VRIAVHKAGERARGSVLASDAFFPFPDGVEAAMDAGVRAILEPGGSVRDDEVQAACEARGVPLVFSGVRHFRH